MSNNKSTSLVSLSMALCLTLGLISCDAPPMTNANPVQVAKLQIAPRGLAGETQCHEKL